MPRPRQISNTELQVVDIEFQSLVNTRAQGVLALRANYSKYELEELSLDCLVFALNRTLAPTVRRHWGRRTLFIRRMINQLVGPIPRR